MPEQTGSTSATPHDITDLYREHLRTCEEIEKLSEQRRWYQSTLEHNERQLASKTARRDVLAAQMREAVTREAHAAPDTTEQNGPCMAGLL
ncbi:MAG: hypothetical protein LC772_06820 [Chloroflexi bacterium]|nr:hypothetical protein [Chloroflexota bacterium]